MPVALSWFIAGMVKVEPGLLSLGGQCKNT